MGSCCPFLSGGTGSPPYLLWAFVIFSVITLVVMIKKLNIIIKLLENK